MGVWVVRRGKLWGLIGVWAYELLGGVHYGLLGEAGRGYMVGYPIIM